MKKILFATALIWLGCEKNTVSKSNLASAEKIMGLEFTRSERDSLLDGVNNRISQFEELRSLALPNNVAFPLYYNPLPAGMNPPVGKDKFDFNDTPTERPEIIEACAFMSVPQLAYLIRTDRKSVV